MRPPRDITDPAGSMKSPLARSRLYTRPVRSIPSIGLPTSLVVSVQFGSPH